MIVNTKLFPRMGMQEQAEAMRLTAGSSSPINDTIKLLLDQIDASNIKGIFYFFAFFFLTCPCRSSRNVGGPSEHQCRATDACGRSEVYCAVGSEARRGALEAVHMYLLTVNSKLTTPVAKLLSKLKSSALKSKSPSVRSHYAQCMGFLCRHASDSAIKRLLDSLKEVYSQSAADGKQQKQQ